MSLYVLVFLKHFLITTLLIINQTIIRDPSVANCLMHSIRETPLPFHHLVPLDVIYVSFNVHLNFSTRQQ